MNKRLFIPVVTLVMTQSALALTVAVPGREANLKIDTMRIGKYEAPGGNAIETIHFDAGNPNAVFQEGVVYQQRCAVLIETIGQSVRHNRPDAFFGNRFEETYGCNARSTPPC